MKGGDKIEGGSSRESGNVRENGGTGPALAHVIKFLEMSKRRGHAVFEPCSLGLLRVGGLRGKKVAGQSWRRSCQNIVRNTLFGSCFEVVHQAKRAVSKIS